MKKITWTAVIMLLTLAGLVLAQSADEEYIRAMQLNDPCQKTQALKAYLSKYSGKGTTYEHYAWAFLCLTPCPSKSDQESIQAGEKALAMAGIDDNTKVELLMTLSALYSRANQTEKANSYAEQLIAFAKANREKDPSQSLQWTKIMGAGYLLIGQAHEKAKNLSAAADAYINAYQLIKDPKISASLRKIGKTLYDGQRYAEAEKIFRHFYAAAQDSESAIILGQTLFKSGKTDEALKIFKEAYARKKSGELAYNIGIILANKAKTDASVTQEAINVLIEAGLLYPPQSKQALGIANSLFLGDNKELKESFAKIEEHKKAIEELTKTFNDRFGDKSEDELSDREKQALQKLREAIATEQEAINKLQAQQKSVIDKFNQLVAQVKARLGK